MPKNVELLTIFISGQAMSIRKRRPFARLLLSSVNVW